jgi:hypothetical protein
MPSFSERFAAVPGELASEFSSIDGKTESHRTELCEAQNAGIPDQTLGADPGKYHDEWPLP